MRRRKSSWADKAGVPIGALGDVCEGVVISEEGRVTNYMWRKAGVEGLLREAAALRKSGIQAVVYGLLVPSGAAKYAIFRMRG